MRCRRCGQHVEQDRVEAVRKLVALFGLADNARLCRCRMMVWVRRPGRRGYYVTGLVDPLVDESWRA